MSRLERPGSVILAIAIAALATAGLVRDVPGQASRPSTTAPSRPSPTPAPTDGASASDSLITMVRKLADPAWEGRGVGTPASTRRRTTSPAG